MHSPLSVVCKGSEDKQEKMVNLIPIGLPYHSENSIAGEKLNRQADTQIHSTINPVAGIRQVVHSEALKKREKDKVESQGKNLHLRKVIDPNRILTKANGNITTGFLIFLWVVVVLVIILTVAALISLFSLIFGKKYGLIATVAFIAGLGLFKWISNLIEKRKYHQ